MRTLITLVVLLFCLQLWSQVPDTTSVAPGRLIIKVNQAFQTIGTRSDGIIETDQPWFNNLAIQYQIDVLQQIYVGSTRTYQQNKYLICFPHSLDLETVVSSFDLQSSVQDVRYDFYVHLCTNDPFNSYQWNYVNIHANDGYYTLANGIQAPQAVRIAVVDTGIDYNHPDLSNNILRDQNNNVIGYNFVFPGQPAMDDNGHGSLVAGIIAAQTNNNTGISSLAVGNNVKLMPIKAFARDRTGYISDVCDGIQWAINSGAQIINCSWVIYQDTVWPEELLDLINDNQNVLFIAARGYGVTTYPGSWSPTKANVIAVGGSSIDNLREDNGAVWVSVCAPSGTQSGWIVPHDTSKGIVSTLPIYDINNPYQMHYSVSDPAYSTFQMGSWQDSSIYDFLNGTSLSAAHVSGLMGMLYAQHYSALTSQPPTMDVGALKNIVIKSASDFNSNAYADYNGWGSGIINAHEALMTPHPNLSLRQYQIGTADPYSYPLPVSTQVWNLPSMEWGGSQSIKFQIKNKWVAGTNVRVSMSTTDPNITFSYPGEIDRYNIGNIAAETTIWTENMWIRDWSNQVRTNVPITITILANGMPDRVHTIYINVLQSSAAIVGSITMQPGETITTDLVVSNLDDIGDDELIVGTSAGRLFCYRNNVWIHVGTLPQGFSVSPAIGDINADGHKEIVAIDSVGNVRVFSNSFVLLRPYPAESNEIVTWSVALEDVTGDNILDILYTTDRTNQSLVDAGLRVIDFYTNNQYSYTSDRVIASPVAIGNVDSDTAYEVVIAYKNKYNASGQLINWGGCFGVFKFNNGTFDTIVSEWLLGSNQVDKFQGPIIADCNGDQLPEIVWLSNFTNNNTMIYSYYSLLDGTIWPNVGSPGIPLNIEMANIVDIQPGLSYAILKDSNQSRYLQVGFGGPQALNYLFIGVENSAFSVLSADILDPLPPFPAAETYQQELIVISDNSISYFQPYYTNQDPIMLNELLLYKTTVNSLLRSAAVASYNDGVALCAISLDGMLYSYSYPNRLSKTTEISQNKQSSRHTRCYEQPIPKEVYGNIAINHPFIVDKNTTTHSSIFTINEGVVGRFEAGRSLVLNRSDLNINGIEENPVILMGLGGGSNNDYWNGISVNNRSNLDMKWAEVSGARQALDISSTGQRFIKSCDFNNNYLNVNCYNSTVNMFYNNIAGAIHGISAYHYASPMLNNTLTLQNGLNEISGNEYGIFSDSSIPVLKDGHNNLENDRYNLYLQNPAMMSGPIQARNNWWGHTNYREVEATINLPVRVEFYPFDMQPNHTIVREDQGSSMFEEGYAYMLDGEYLNAITCFNYVLADSLYNDNDVVSLYALFECHKQLNEISTYESQLNQFLADEMFAPLHKPMKNVRALIFRETGDVAQAIDHYESILLNNPSFQDSCYAVIDLGDTYLECNGRYRGQLSEYIPVSYTMHLQKREALLNSISQLSETDDSSSTVPPLQLLGNYPNPFNPTTTIRFHIKTKSNVKINIYNLRGQKVTTLLNENRLAGLNSVVWNGRDRGDAPVASGVYFYRIECDGTTKTAKMLLMK